MISYKKLTKQIHILFLLLLLFLIFFIISTSTNNSLLFPLHPTGGKVPNFGNTYASFNASEPQCINPKGGVRVWGSVFETYDSRYYLPCKNQILSDFDFLAQHNVSTIRIWPVLSTFAYDSSSNTWDSTLNSNISNLDEVLNQLARDHMKAYITLMNTTDCNVASDYTTNLGYNFNPSLVNDPTLQNQFIAALSTFIARYKDNTTIAAYDLVNEINVVLSQEPPAGRISGGLCGLFYGDQSNIKLKAFLTRIYNTVKGIDPIHPVTFSSGNWYPTSSYVYTTTKDIVDFYDFHAYSNDPKAYYEGFPTYDKPVIHGEVGYSERVNDNSGNDCEGDGYDVLPAMVSECQTFYLSNTRAWIVQSKLHNIQNIFFHQWPSSKQFGVRLYNTNNQLTGYLMTSAGQYIL